MNRNARFSRSTTMMTILFTFLGVVIFIGQVSALSPNDNGWKKLIENSPFEAQKVFKKNCSSPDRKIAGEAYRGCAFVYKFLGEHDSAMVMLFRAFLADKDTCLFNATWINIISFGRDWIGHSVKDGYKVMGMLTKLPTLFNGEHTSLFADRYVNDGALSKARKLVDRMGIVRSFMMIGPFDNISGSGYKKAYPPEEELDFTKMYPAKDGAQTGWFPYTNQRPTGWLFTEYNYPSSSAILYYYANVYSEMQQTVNLGFGASGCFKVFLNDNPVLADSIFRNTGTDMFMQKVTLHKGDNKLLIKIGHESRNSNFLIRFMDDQGRMLPTIRYLNTAGTFTKDATIYDDLTRSPLTEEIEHVLFGRLDANPKDLEAAVVLMDFYNASELFDDGQKLAQRILKQFPNSSLWRGMYSESLVRSRKLTEAQTELKTAFRSCPYNFYAWQHELDLISEGASSREVMDFIAKSYEPFRRSVQAQLVAVGHYAKTENEMEALRVVDYLQTRYFNIDIVVNLLASMYISQGNGKKAEALLKNFLRYERSSTDIYSLLAELYLRQGQRGKAVKTYLQSLTYSPDSPGFYYYLAKLALQYKEIAQAQSSIQKGLTIAPTSSAMIALKGTMLNTQGKKQEAIKAFKESIQYTYNYFDAWEQLLPLEGKPELSSLTKLPEPAALKKEAASWQPRHNENGVILAYIKDIFLYPSRCSRERRFLMVNLPTQNAIDVWKEYSISYNGYYQAATISRAYSIAAGGDETPADMNNDLVVFKSLRPGDDIVIEWLVENHYQQDMARHVWGDYDFSLPYPVYSTELRLVCPKSDTIGFHVQGDSIHMTQRTVSDFNITTFSRTAYINPPRESYELIDPPDMPKVSYSTFNSWADIANWYSNLTENKLNQTLELKVIADSILAGTRTAEEKVQKIHHYITEAIRYSYVPFRQGAWIPQSARDVCATKIGDCKDMASLGKTLLDYAGVECNLVLVNTSDQNSIFPSYIGPNFNHCILSFTLNGTTRFVDMTDNSLSVAGLPRMDQGALALIIKRGNDSLIRLPLDSVDNRRIRRDITTGVTNEGTLFQQVATMKSGVFASSMRSSYRYLSDEERKKDLRQIMVKSYPNAVIDSFNFVDLDSLRDTVTYAYSYSAKNAVQFSGNTALFAVQLPDKIAGESYPSEEERVYPIDMTRTWFGIGSFGIRDVITVPSQWKLINVPQTISLNGTWGAYRLSFEIRGEVITCRRDATFNFTKPIANQEAAELRKVLSQIAQADNIQFMFYVK